MFEPTLAQINLILAQRTDLHTLVTQHYEETCKQEAASIAPFVSEYDTVLDIGAGLGGYWKFIPKPKALDLLDYNQVDTKITYGLQEKGEAYNLTDETRRFLGDIVRDQYDVLIERPHGPYDIIVSLLSWGYHYPWSTYADLVHEILVANGLLILDVRKIAVPLVMADQRFAVKDVLRDSLKSQRLLLQRLPT